jgi:hypothetical protein
MVVTFWMSLILGLEMFFVGDAAGRMSGHATSRMKDHGDTDRYTFRRHSDE